MLLSIQREVLPWKTTMHYTMHARISRDRVLCSDTILCSNSIWCESSKFKIFYEQFLCLKLDLLVGQVLLPLATFSTCGA